MSNISAVICIKNGENTLENALKSLSNNKPDEIIVVDGNSKDNSISIAREYTNNIYSDDGQGLAYARQLGAEKSKNEYVAFVDCDTKLPKDDILISMVQELKDNNWVAIHSQLVDPRDDKTYWEMGEDFHWRNTFNKAGKREYLGTIVCIIKKELIMRYGFDNFFSGAAEDGDFYIRLTKEGYEFGVSSAVSYHYHRSSFKDFYKQRIWYGKGNSKIVKKHGYYKIIFSPFLIFIYGIYLSVFKKKIEFIPFYFLWMVYLFYGTVSGFIETRNELDLNIKESNKKT